MKEHFQGSLYIGQKLLAIPTGHDGERKTLTGNDYAGTSGVNVSMSCFVNPDGAIEEIKYNAQVSNIDPIDRYGIGTKL